MPKLELPNIYRQLPDLHGYDMKSLSNMVDDVTTSVAGIYETFFGKVEDVLAEKAKNKNLLSGETADAVSLIDSMATTAGAEIDYAFRKFVSEAIADSKNSAAAQKAVIEFSVLAVQKISQDKNNARSAIISGNNKLFSPFIAADKKEWRPFVYMKTLTRGSAVGAIFDSEIERFRDEGLKTATISHEKADHASRGIVFNIEDAVEIAEVRKKYFHPNSKSFLVKSLG